MRADCLIGCVTLIIFSPVVSGKPVNEGAGRSPSMLQPPTDIHGFPLDKPGIGSIPLAFFLGWLGTVTSRERSTDAKAQEMQVRSLTGIGAERRPLRTGGCREANRKVAALHDNPRQGLRRVLVMDLVDLLYAVVPLSILVTAMVLSQRLRSRRMQVEEARPLNLEWEADVLRFRQQLGSGGQGW